MPSSSPTLMTRRQFLGVTAGAAGLLAAPGCALPEPDDTPDPVLDLVLSAERDAREFASADRTHGDHVGALHRLADVRRIQAGQLEAALTSPRQTPTPTPAPSAGSPEPVRCPPVDEVRTRLRADIATATEVALAESGIRAELAGAVAASCTAAVEVLLT